MADWRKRISDEIVELIRHANHGRSPASREDWLEVAERFQVDLSVRRFRSRYRAIRIEDVIAVCWHVDPARVHRRITHEMTEYLLTSDWASPFNFTGDCGAVERHRIARLIERRL